MLENALHWLSSETLTSGQPIGTANGRREATIPLKSRCNQHPPVYWWNNNIAALQKVCFKARKAKARAGMEMRNYEEVNEKNKTMQLELVKSIKASKRQCWHELLQEIDGDVWGRRYKVAMKRLKSQAMPSPTCPVLLKRIVETLFPQQPICEIQLQERDNEAIPPVTIEELRKEFTNVGNHKCPGLNGIPNIALKAAIEAKSDTFLSMYTKCLQEGVFPEKWRQQRLVLLPKEKKATGKIFILSSTLPAWHDRENPRADH